MWLANIHLFPTLYLLLFVSLTASRPVYENNALVLSPRTSTQIIDPFNSREPPQEELGQKSFCPSGNTGVIWCPLGILCICGTLIEETKSRCSHPPWTLIGADEGERPGLCYLLGQSSIDRKEGRRWYCIRVSRGHSSGSILAKLERRENTNTTKPRTKRQKIVAAVVLTIVLLLSCGWFFVCLIVFAVWIIKESYKKCVGVYNRGLWRKRFRRTNREIAENSGLNEWGRKVKEVSRMENVVIREPKTSVEELLGKVQPFF